jgi:hypothetical protein
LREIDLPPKLLDSLNLNDYMASLVRLIDSDVEGTMKDNEEFVTIAKELHKETSITKKNPESNSDSIKLEVDIPLLPEESTQKKIIKTQVDDKIEMILKSTDFENKEDNNKDEKIKFKRTPIGVIAKVNHYIASKFMKHKKPENLPGLRKRINSFLKENLKKPHAMPDTKSNDKKEFVQDLYEVNDEVLSETNNSKYHAADPLDMSTHLKDLQKNWSDCLEKCEKKQIYDYTLKEYREMNKQLRGMVDKTEPIQKKCMEMDYLISKNKLQEEITVYRGINIHGLKGLLGGKNPKIGDTFTDLGFISTTINSENSFNKDITLFQKGQKQYILHPLLLSKKNRNY